MHFADTQRHWMPWLRWLSLSFSFPFFGFSDVTRRRDGTDSGQAGSYKGLDTEKGNDDSLMTRFGSGGMAF
jgi:hypothetical protein